MHNQTTPWLFTACWALFLGACFSSGGDGPTRVTAGSDETNVPMVMDAAAQLYRAGGGHVGFAGYQAFTSPASFESEAYALYQIDAVTLSSGLGIHLIHSPWFAEAAAAPGAPEDLDQNGTNLDELFEVWQERLAKAAGAQALTGIWPTLVEFERGNPALAQPLDLLRLDLDLSSLRWDRQGMVKVLASETLGRTLYAQVLSAKGRLSLLQDLGLRHGAEPAEALRGLISIQAAWDKARFLLEQLAFDGMGLGAVDPATYDPAQELRYFPDRIRIEERPSPYAGLPPAVGELDVVDPTSSLVGQAELLRGAVELYWLSSPTNPMEPYRALFDGDPFPAAGAPNSPHRMAAGLVQVLLANLEAMHFLEDPGTFVDQSLPGLPGREVTTTAVATVVRALADLEAAGGAGSQVRDWIQAQANFLRKRLLDPETGMAFDGFDLDRGPKGRGSLISQLAMVEALLFSYQVLEEPEFFALALDLATRIEREFWLPELGLLRTHLGSNRIVWTPSTTAWLAAGLRAVRIEGLYPGAADLYAGALLQASSLLQLLLAEDERTGEPLGDGLADTNGNGIPGLMYAGGPYGMAPMLAERRELLFTTLPSTGVKDPVATITVTWSQGVQPIFIRSCACHTTGGTSGALSLSTYEDAMRGGGSQAKYPNVIPFNASQSLLYLKLILDTPPVGGRMPYFQDPLSPDALKKVRDWINQGAKNN